MMRLLEHEWSQNESTLTDLWIFEAAIPSSYFLLAQFQSPTFLIFYYYSLISVLFLCLFPVEGAHLKCLYVSFGVYLFIFTSSCWHALTLNLLIFPFLSFEHFVSFVFSRSCVVGPLGVLAWQSPLQITI